jgi:hypothetical protein
MPHIGTIGGMCGCPWLGSRMTTALPPTADAIQSLIRELLEQSDFEGREALLAQVDGVEYIDGPVTMMCLRVAQSFPPSSGVPSPVPNDPIVLDETGEPIGGLLLWLDDAGYIDCLEYWWTTDEMPTDLPSPDRLAAWPG